MTTPDPASPPEPATAFTPNTGLTPTTADQFQLGTLRSVDRTDLVNVTNPIYAADGARPFRISNLELTALGATAEIEGNWSWTSTDPSRAINLAAWHDLGQHGRAVKGLVTRRGYLFPLGHRATITTYFERAFAADPSNGANHSDASDFAVGYLQSHTVLRVSEQVKTYGTGTPGEPWTAGLTGGSADWPFAKVRMITLKTPDLDPVAGEGEPVPAYQWLLDAGSRWHRQAIWPTYTVAGKPGVDVLWSFVVTDLDGHDAGMTMPLVFVFGQDTSASSPYTGSPFGGDGFTDALVQAYHASSETGHARYSDTGGVGLRLAPEAGGVVGGTRHPTLAIMLTGTTSSLDPNTPTPPHSPGAGALAAAGQPDFYPVLRRARIRLHAAEVLTGQDVDDSGGLLPGPGVEVEWYPDYVSGDFSLYGAAGQGSNRGAVYLRIADDSLSLQLPANTTGGIGTPNTSLAGLSAIAGTVGGDLSSFAQNAPNTDLSSYFPVDLDPELLGGLHLSDILDAGGFQMPTLSLQSLASAAGLSDEPGLPPTNGREVVSLDDVSTRTDPATGAQTVTYSLQTPLTTTSVFVPDDPGATLSMSATVESSLDGSPPTYTANGSIDPFTVTLESLIALHFASFTFSAGSGQSTSVDPDLDNVSFEGCLEFVNTLEQFLSSLGAGGLSIHVGPTQVTLGLSLSIPAVQTGMFNLSGIGFSVGAVLPFLTGKAIATFAFASSDNPFTLTCCCFGGGGFVSVGVGFGGLQTLQSSFEVEGQAAIGIVVASGNVTFAVGIYYSYDEAGGADLSGFVTLSGQVELLGIISVSITMHISLTWEITAGAVQGTATLEVGISICGFGVTVGVTVSKSFGGSTSNSSSVSSGVSPGDDAQLARPSIAPPPPPGSPVGGVGTGTLHGSSGGDGLPGPRYPAGPITFAQLISKTDWLEYCEAF